LQTLVLHETGQLTTHCHCLSLAHYMTLSNYLHAVTA